MKHGQTLIVDGVEVTLWARAPRHLSTHLYDPWWVTRVGPTGKQEMWAIGRERRHGRFSANWRLIGRYTWQGRPIN